MWLIVLFDNIFTFLLFLYNTLEYIYTLKICSCKLSYKNIKIRKVDFMKTENCVNEKLISEEEKEKLVRISMNERYGGMILCGLLCGIRKNEVIALTENDVDFNSNTILINKVYDKGISSVRDRIVSMPDIVAEKIKETIGYNHKSPDSLNAEKLIFPDFKGGYLSDHFIYRWLDETALKAGIHQHIPFHTLRRYYLNAMHEIDE